MVGADLILCISVLAFLACHPLRTLLTAVAPDLLGPLVDMLNCCMFLWDGRITESQNHRMVGIGRDLCGSSSPTPLPKQGHLQQAAQDPVQVGLEYLQRRRLHSLPGQPVPVLCHPQREEGLPHVQMELPMPQFVPVTPCPVAGHP